MTGPDQRWRPGLWLGLAGAWLVSWLARRYSYRKVCVHDYGEGEAARAAFWWQMSQADAIMAVLTIFIFFLASVKVIAMMVRASNAGDDWTIGPTANHTYLTLERDGQQPPFMDPGQHCPTFETGESARAACERVPSDARSLLASACRRVLGESDVDQRDMGVLRDWHDARAARSQ